MEIEPLYDDGGGSYGYYAKGIHNPKDFVAAVNKDWDEDIKEESVRHGLRRLVPVMNCEYDHAFVEAKRRSKGAFDATYAEVSDV